MTQLTVTFGVDSLFLSRLRLGSVECESTWTWVDVGSFRVDANFEKSGFSTIFITKRNFSSKLRSLNFFWLVKIRVDFDSKFSSRLLSRLEPGRLQTLVDSSKYPMAEGAKEKYTMVGKNVCGTQNLTPQSDGLQNFEICYFAIYKKITICKICSSSGGLTHAHVCLMHNFQVTKPHMPLMLSQIVEGFWPLSEGRASPFNPFAHL